MGTTSRSKVKRTNIKGRTTPVPRFCGRGPPRTVVEGFVTTGREWSETGRSPGVGGHWVVISHVPLMSQSFSWIHAIRRNREGLCSQMSVCWLSSLPKVSSNIRGTGKSWFLWSSPDGVILVLWFWPWGSTNLHWNWTRTLCPVPASCASFRKGLLVQNILGMSLSFSTVWNTAHIRVFFWSF